MHLPNPHFLLSISRCSPTINPSSTLEQNPKTKNPGYHHPNSTFPCLLPFLIFGREMASSSSESQFPDWASLPCDLLEYIGNLLPFSFDYISFRSVCSRWRLATQRIKFAPLVMLPFDANTGVIKFFSPSDERPFSLNLPLVCDKLFCGTTQGMVVLMDESASISLVNPFTRAQIELPPADEQLALVSGWHVMMVEEKWALYSKNTPLRSLFVPIKLSDLRWIFIKEVVLSSHPNSGEECYVMATLASSTKVAFCILGDEAWELVDTNLSCNIQFVTYCNRRFYAVDLDGKIAFCELDNPMNFTSLPLPAMLHEESAFRLLESKGELLMVAFVIHVEWDLENVHHGYHYDIYKLDMLEEPTWSRVNNICEETFFVSRYYDCQYVGTGLHRCRGNCIYFPEPTEYVPGFFVPEILHMEVVSIADGSKQFVSTQWTIDSPEYVSWFKPNLL